MLYINPVSNGSMSTPPYKDLNGTQYTSVSYGTNTYYESGYSSRYLSFRGLIPVATADELSNYSFEDYEITEVGTTSYTTQRIATNDVEHHKYRTSLIYNISITNNTETDITVNCIRFKAKINATSQNSNQADYLFYSYYLDSPMTIISNDTQSVSITFMVSN